MKGQYEVITEVLLFAMGIAIASFVLLNFGNINRLTQQIGIQDQLESTADLILSGIARALQNDPTNITIAISKKVSDRSYQMQLQGNRLTLVADGDPPVQITREVFNMTQRYTILADTISSSAGFIDVTFSGNTLRVKRSEKISQQEIP